MGPKRVVALPEGLTAPLEVVSLQKSSLLVRNSMRGISHRESPIRQQVGTKGSVLIESISRGCLAQPVGFVGRVFFIEGVNEGRRCWWKDSDGEFYF